MATTERGTGVGVTVEMIETLAVEDTIEMTVVAEEAAGEIVTMGLNGRDNHNIAFKLTNFCLGLMIRTII